MLKLWRNVFIYGIRDTNNLYKMKWNFNNLQTKELYTLFLTTGKIRL
jgi:hypothetical protein